MKVRLSALLASLSLLTACAGEDDVDLGSGPIEQQGNSLVAFSGSWDGYAEGYTFKDGSDRVRLTIDANGNGSLTIGDSAPAVVPPATSGYAHDAGVGVGETLINPGFGYPIIGANVESKRLRASLDPMHFFSAYCEQLPSYEVGPATLSGFSCTRSGGGYASSDGVCSISLGADGRPAYGPLPQELVNHPIDCGLAACQSYCECTASGCTAMNGEMAWGSKSSFDGALEDNGSKLVGTLVLGRGGSTRLTLRLTRD